MHTWTIYELSRYKFDPIVKVDKESITVELPGVKKDQIKVTIEDGTVRLIAKKGDLTCEKQWILGSKADINKTSAKLEDGILTINLVEKPKDIKVIEIQ